MRVTVSKAPKERVQRGRLRKGKCPKHGTPLVPMGASEKGVPIVGCPEKWCRFKVEARKGTDLYKALYWKGHGPRDGRLFDQAELRRKVRLAIAEVIRTEFAHATMEDLSGLAELYPDVTLDDLLGRNGRSKVAREKDAQPAQEPEE